VTAVIPDGSWSVHTLGRHNTGAAKPLVEYPTSRETISITKEEEMLYSYLELPDGTLVTHSNVCEDNTVEVRVERPIEGGFNTALCTLPSFRWSEQDGFSDDELADLDDLVRHNAPLIMRYAREVTAQYA
jgi:hypothetical protein